MPDREKVIKGLEILMNGCEYIQCEDCCFYISTKPCRCGLREEQIQEDSLALLKEQEPIMIKTVMINGSGRNGRCQNCLMMLNEMDYPNFCGNCGQAVKWER
ncbi:MAG: hypothetical protein IIZ93_14210 [Acidaminococcaceae bacterium]|nr:hypothetical protein [Acidaminococcaceae bacterium]